MQLVINSPLSTVVFEECESREFQRYAAGKCWKPIDVLVDGRMKRSGGWVVSM